jgi:hypothetical protein
MRGVVDYGTRSGAGWRGCGIGVIALGSKALGRQLALAPIGAALTL